MPQRSARSQKVEASPCSCPGKKVAVMRSHQRAVALRDNLIVATLLAPLACVAPPPASSQTPATAAPSATADAGTSAPANQPPAEAMAELDAWGAAARMAPGVNIGNTLENTKEWET